MNRKTLTLGLLILLGSLTVQANTDYEQTYIEQHRELLSVPAPIEVIRPVLLDPPADLKVEVLLEVDSLGRVTSAEVASSTDSRFNRQILNSVQRWRFRPAIVDGRPVNEKVIIPFVKTVDDSTLVAQK